MIMPTTSLIAPLCGGPITEVNRYVLAQMIGARIHGFHTSQNGACTMRSLYGNAPKAFFRSESVRRGAKSLRMRCENLRCLKLCHSDSSSDSRASAYAAKTKDQTKAPRL